MTLSPKEQQQIIALASGALPPDTGMEKHFVMVVNGKGRACSPKEKEWLSFWSSHADASSATDQDPRLPPKETASSTISAQPAPPSSTSFSDEFDTGPDLAFEDEVVFEEAREKLGTLLASKESYQSLVQQLAHINEALKAAHTTPPSDIKEQLAAAESKLVPF